MEAAQKLGERHRVVWGLALVFFVASLAMGLKVLPVMDEDFSDIMYFFVVTLSTVGYGDIVVASEPAMIFMVFYSFFGLLLAASIIGILSVQSLHRREEKRLENESQLDSQHLGLFVEEDDDEADEQSGGNSGMCGGSMRQSFRMWCGQQHTVLRVLFSAAPYLGFVIFGSFVIGSIENWTTVEALYFGFTTATTIGYGDVVPDDYRGKWLCVFYIPMSVILIARFFGEVADIFVQTEIEAMDKITMAERFDVGTMIDEVCSSKGNVKINELEFTIFMLKAMNKVDERVLGAIHNQFNNLDKKKTGHLDQGSMKEFQRQSNSGRKSVMWATSPQAASSSSGLEIVPKTRGEEDVLGSIC